jgi:hypothetical protein
MDVPLAGADAYLEDQRRVWIEIHRRTDKYEAP